MADGDGLGQLGLFLTLAFLIPGLVYLAAFAVFFTEPSLSFIDWARAHEYDGILLSALAILFGLIVVGLLATAVTFCIEFALRSVPGIRRLVPPLNFQRIVLRQLSGQNVSYLVQQAGQAIMHYNVWSGVLVFFLIYLLAASLGLATWAWWRLVFASLVVGANMFAAKKFFGWVADTLALDLSVPKMAKAPQG